MIYLKRKIIFILSLIGLCLPVISQADWVSHTALPASNIRVITYDAGNSTYYAGASDFPSPGVYSKTESGTTWTLVGPESGDAAYYGDVRSLLRASNTLYVGGANTVYQKADTDAGWTQVGNNITNPISLVRYNDTLIAAAAGGVFTLNLTSPSATWTRLGPASGSGSLTSAANLYLAFSKLYASSNGTVVSFDFTAMTPSWVQLGPNNGAPGGLPMFNIIRSITYKNSVVFVATAQGVFCSKLVASPVWQKVGPASGAGSFSGDTSSIITSSDNTKVYVAADNAIQSVTVSPAISTTTDFTSLSWTTVGSTFVYANQILQVGTNLYAATYLGVLKTPIVTPSWSDISAGLPQQQPYSLIHFGSALLAGTKVGVYQTDNNFHPWHLVGPASGAGAARDYSIALLHANSKIYVGTDGGVFYRNDTEALESDWIIENPPTPAVQFNNSTACLANSPSSIFAGTFDGVFSRTGNAVWTDISAPGTSWLTSFDATTNFFMPIPKFMPRRKTACGAKLMAIARSHLSDLLAVQDLSPL